MKTAANILAKHYPIEVATIDGTLNYIINAMEEYASQFQAESVTNEEYLNDCIKKATPNLSKIKNVDKALDEIRGIDPVESVTDEEIERWAAGRVNEIDPDKYGYGDLLIEGAKWLRSRMSK